MMTISVLTLFIEYNIIIVKCQYPFKVVGYSVAKEPTETPVHLLLTRQEPKVQSYRLHLEI